jgi:hypothetical protein
MNSMVDGSADGKITSSLMEEPTSADFGKSSEIDGPADVGSELFRDGVPRFGSMGIHPRL